jgi:hypothetical protein
MRVKLGCELIAAGLVFASVVAPAFADEMNKKTIFHFSSAVEIPGRVLTPGTYVFEEPEEGHMVTIFSEDKSGTEHLVSTIETAPAYRSDVSGKPILTFEKRDPHSPQAVDEFFYPGDNDGVEFLYPKSE